MAKISSLTDNTNQIVYPQTKANAVIMEDSTTVENAIAQRPKMVLSAEEPASTIADNTLYGVYGDVGQITTGEIADSAVTTAKIASSAVTEAKLGAGAVTTDKLGSSAVTTAKIANGAVTGVTNSATSIGSAKLALNTVGTPNLRDGAVTSDKVDWTTLPFQYKVTNRVDFTSPTAWTPYYPSGWDFTFNTVAGGVYYIQWHTEYLNDAASPVDELDFKADFPTSSQISSTYIGFKGAYTHNYGMPRMVFAVIKAAGTSVRTRANVSCSTQGRAIKLYGGSCLVFRIQ